MRCDNIVHTVQGKLKGRKQKLKTWSYILVTLISVSTHLKALRHRPRGLLYIYCWGHRLDTTGSYIFIKTLFNHPASTENKLRAIHIAILNDVPELKVSSHWHLIHHGYHIIAILLKLVGCWRLTSWQQLRSYEDRYRLVTMHTYGVFYSVAALGNQITGTMIQYPTLPRHWANQSLLYPIKAEHQAWQVSVL